MSALEFIQQKTAAIKEQAESTDFFKLMASGSISPEFYAIYLWQQIRRYDYLEDRAEQLGLLKDFPSLTRYKKTRADYDEIWKGMLNKKYMCPYELRATTDFQKRVKAIFEDDLEDSMQIYAYMWVMYQTNLVGRQYLKDKVPGTATFFDFDTDIANLESRLNAGLTEDMAEWAIHAYENNIQLYNELWTLDVPKFK